MSRQPLVKDGRLRPILRALIYLVLWIFGTVFLAIVLALGAKTVGLVHFDPNDQFAAGIYFTIGAPLAALAVALVLRRFMDRRSIASLGLSFRSRWWLLLLTGACLGMLLEIPRFVWAAVHGQPLISLVVIGNPALERLMGVSGGVDVALVSLSVLASDIAIRGYVFQNIWEEWGVFAAIAVSVACDLLMGLGTHVAATTFESALVIIALSILLGLSVVWTGSLWFAIGFHLVWNILEDPSQLQPNLATTLSMLVVGILVLYFAKRSGFRSDAAPREAYSQPSA